MVNCKLGLSVSNKIINEELFKEFAKADIKLMEISTGFGEYSNLNFDEIKCFADKYGVELWSVHLPFMPFNKIDISKPDLAEQAIELFKAYIEKANKVGIKVFIVHPSGEPIGENEREARMLCAKQSLKRLADYATKLDCVIAIEDIPRSCLGHNSAEILDLISVHKNLRVCFDTNHLLEESNIDFIRNVGEKIITTHISDYDFINERHWLPGEGNVDWVELVEALESINYNGPWLYEIGFKPSWSIERDRDLRCDDFKNNFLQVINKHSIDKIGTPKGNLGMWAILD